MTEFIGSRISLISKRDIRYVGTLHEISSENSTVALEQVVSFGTEGRRPDDEVPPSDNVYEYIVFRGSDVKDLRIEEPPKEIQPPKPPQVPDDPAIVNSARRPTPSSQQVPKSQPPAAQPERVETPGQSQQQQNQPSHINQHNQQRQPHPSQFQQPPFPYYYPLPNQRFGPHGFPTGPAFPGMPYGAPPPPGWYPPPGQGFHHMGPGGPGQFHPNQMPIGPPGSQQRQPPFQPQQTSEAKPVPVEGNSVVAKPDSPANTNATVKLPSSANTPAPVPGAQSAPPLPTDTKPDASAALAPPATTAAAAGTAASKPVPTGPKSGRIIPAVPLSSPLIKAPVAVNGAPKLTTDTPAAPATSQAPTTGPANKTLVLSKSIEEANRDARAAVAAAMAKLPPAPGAKKPAEAQGAMDNLTKKVNEMRTNDTTRGNRHPGTGGYAARGGRGHYRGGRAHSDQKKIEVPATDYDFESANAKFNKQDLVKEAIASGSPLTTSAPSLTSSSSAINGTGTENETKAETVAIPGVAYNKTSSFFDNISSEIKDRTEESGNRLGGREFRNEERQKNLETFGQGSVDNGYRGGYGRGRGRGRGYSRGRGGYGPRGGRGGPRGARGGITTNGDS
ncbi:MAG: hypothetical protein MMC33_002602 [Icmadophila ericetorum]|nr:hypothetical protein [Icmadophila ericetorum]